MAQTKKRETAAGEPRWDVRWRTPDGRVRTRSFRRRGDATRFASTVEADKARGDWLDPDQGRVTFASWADEWQRATAHLRPKTRASYESILKSHLRPAFAKMPVQRIDHALVRRFIAELVAKGAGAGTVLNVHRVLSQILEVARKSGAIRTNPCEGIKLPSIPKQEMVFLSGDEVVALADAIHPSYRTLILFAAYTGLRAGELAGLRVGKVDLLRRTVTIDRTISESNGRLVEGPTKTNQRRVVPLPAFLVDELVVHLGERAGSPRALVFVGPDGGPLRHGNFYSRAFKPAVKKAGLPETTRFHDLRHTCAALLIAAGAHPKAIAELLGHSTITVTLDRYGHLFPSLAESLADQLDATFKASQAPKLAPVQKLTRDGRAMALNGVRGQR